MAMCRRGVHACRADQLSFWLHEELWKVELDGDLSSGLDCVLAPRGRLVARVDEWSERGGAQRFSIAVRDHAAALVAAASAEERGALQGYVDDSSWHVRHAQLESPALSALCASMAVAQLSAWTTRRQGTAEPAALEDAYRFERAWQSAWIVREMGLA
ncbi:MAG TPA: hypothetical protein VHJ20_10320 [Polyangia bacterium]|nr:hypothetical protein [Polyangia bacterium]